jgi:uncharacterized protein (TIGR00730 family)
MPGAFGRRRLRQEQGFLVGPRRRRYELRSVTRIAVEFVRGFRRLHFLGPCVTVFGSARIAEGEPAYENARSVARAMGELGFGIITGGGPGIMEAANRGARDVGAVSIGCAIELPAEQSTNPYVDVDVSFEHFFVRKVMLVKYSYAFIVMQGGFGTGDEMFEALTLIQTAKIEEFPVVLMGVEYWAPLVAQIDLMVETGMVSKSDLDLFLVTDSVTQAVTFVEERAVERFSLARRPRAIRVLGEHRAR